MDRSSTNATGNSTVAQADVVLTMTFATAVVLIIVLTTILLVGIVGNILVCVAVFKTRILRVVGNYYIVSLAVSDLLLCLLVLPFATSLEVSGGTWFFGDIICGIWVSIDVFFCTASILNLCAISVDRFRAVTSPLRYSIQRTSCRAIVNIAILWSVSAILSFPAAIALKANNKLPTRGCVLSDDIYYLTVSSCVSFYFPCFVMIILYWRIFRTAQLRARNVVAPTVAVINLQPNAATGGSADSEEDVLHRHDNVKDARQSDRNKISIAKERKAARTLAIVMGVFILCWLPFFTVNITIGLCSTCVMPDQLFSFVTWLGWCNSACNPIIYTVFNKEFRNAFKRILICGRGGSQFRQM
ncbi:5-hydroxytryptamine receptor 1D-like [Saccoglossus kowalevskii]